MTAYTLTVARTRARTHHLDDDGTRWSDTETDQALEAALSACMDEYVAAGGRHWATDTGDVTTTSGAYDISSLNPLEVHGVSLKRNSLYYPLSRQESTEVRRENTETGLTVRVWYTPTFAFPTTASNNLIGDSVSPPEWRAFDEWVCCRAALIMAPKDDERLASLERVEVMLREAVMSRITQTRSRLPSPPRSSWSRWYAWTWDPRNQTVKLGDRFTWGWI